VSDVPDRVEQRRLTFPPSYRLKRRRLIRSLFDRTRDDVQTVVEGCVRLLYRVVDRGVLGHDVPLQVGFAPAPTPRAVLNATGSVGSSERSTGCISTPW